MSNDIYDKPVTSIDPFKKISKDVITDRNELVLQQFLEKQANRKKGIVDEADILINTPLDVNLKVGDYPEFVVEKESSSET